MAESHSSKTQRNQGSLPGEQGTECARRRGVGTTSGRLCVLRLRVGLVSAATVAQSGLWTGRQRHREGLVSTGWHRRWLRPWALGTAVLAVEVQ